MATTVANRIERVRRYVGASRRSVNRLAASIDASIETITFEFDSKAVGSGSVLAIDDELLHVWDANTTAKTATVLRGFEGTSAATHADGAVVEVDARFPRVEIKDALREEIASWPPSLFTVGEATLTALTTRRSLDLDLDGDDFLFVIEVRREPYAISEVGGATTWPSVDFDVRRNLPLADFPSGSALFLHELPDRARRLQVTYAKPFDTSTFADATDLEATVGLAPYMVDIPIFGAAWRLLSGQEAERSNTRRQGEPRNAEEVPPGYALNTAAGLRTIRDQRIAEAAERLRATYPVRF